MISVYKLYINNTKKYNSIESMVKFLHKNGAEIYNSDGYFLDDMQIELVADYESLFINEKTTEKNKSIIKANTDIKSSVRNDLINAVDKMLCKYCDTHAAIKTSIALGSATICTKCMASDYSPKLKRKLGKIDRIALISKNKATLRLQTN